MGNGQAKPQAAKGKNPQAAAERMNYARVEEASKWSTSTKIFFIMGASFYTDIKEQL